MAKRQAVSRLTPKYLYWFELPRRKLPKWEIRSTRDILGKTSMHNKREIKSGQGETVVWGWHLWEEKKAVRAGGTWECSKVLRKFQPNQWGTTEQWVPVRAPAWQQQPGSKPCSCSVQSYSLSMNTGQVLKVWQLELLASYSPHSSEWHPSMTTKIPFYLWWFSLLRYTEIIIHWITL